MEPQTTVPDAFGQMRAAAQRLIDLLPEDATAARSAAKKCADLGVQMLLAELPEPGYEVRASVDSGSPMISVRTDDVGDVVRITVEGNKWAISRWADRADWQGRHYRKHKFVDLAKALNFAAEQLGPPNGEPR